MFLHQETECRQENRTSVYGVGNHPSRTMEWDLSVSYTSQVTDEGAELKDISCDVDYYEDKRWPTDISSVETRSVLEEEIKRTQSVRDLEYQWEIV
jgi:hypothetical protein